MELYHGPVELGPVLTYLFNNAKMNIYQGQIAINLMNSFPTLKKGYGITDTVANMVYNYAIINNLVNPNDDDYLIADDLFIQAFNSKIPAVYYLIDNGEEILMSDAVNTKLIGESMNTFQVLEIDPQYIHIFSIDDIILINSKPVNVTDDLNYESKVAIEISNIIDKLIKITNIHDRGHYISLYDFIMAGLETDIIKNLIKDIWIHLLYVIIIQDRDGVKDLLKRIDPRVNNNEAYKLALKIGNLEIVNIIKDNIIYTTWLERQVVTNQFENLITPSNIPETLFRHNMR